MVLSIHFPAQLRLLMTRCIDKANNGDHIDRISDLPSNVIDDILYHLPIRDVVRTSVLPRKWRHLWVSAPRLEFGNDFFDKFRHTGDPEIPSIITEVLLLHNAPVYPFALKIPFECPIRIRCLNKWILFLSRNGIRDLRLVNLQTEPYQMPSHLFSYQKLTYLEVDNFELSLPPNFCGFKRLHRLELYCMKFESSALENLISGCPALLVKAQNLSELIMEHDGPVENFEKGRISNLIKGLPEIKMLRLGDGYIKILSAGVILETLQRSFNSLNSLELDGVNFNESEELLFIICLLKSSPNLLKLDIESHSMVVVGQVPNHLKELDCNSCCLGHLQTVNVTVKTAYKHALDLIRILLANSSSLKILTFKIGLGLNQSDTTILLSISRDLLQMERASPRAEVKFLYDGLIE